MSDHPATARRSQIIFAFLCVYFFWGATYTAARVGVQLVPAALLAGVRLAIGSCLMLSFCALRGKKLLGTPREMKRLLLLGALLLFGGNVGLVWAEFYLPSGFSALLVAVVPIYVAIMEWLLPGGERLRLRGQLGIILGFVGLAILIWPSVRQRVLTALFRHAHIAGQPDSSRQILAIIVLLLGAFSFTCGSVLSRRSRLTLDPLVCAGWEMLVASVCDLTVGTAFHQWSHAHWTHTAIAAIGYLILFGSLGGFTAYIWLLSHVPVAKLATYAYVNPIVAVLIGAVLLGERLQPYEYLGMAVTLFAVFLVTSSQMASGRPTAEIECVPIEAEA